MVVINVEISDINTVKDLPNYYIDDKNQVGMDIIHSVFEMLRSQLPELSDSAYSVTFHKSWKKLPKKLYVYTIEDSPSFGVARRRETKSLIKCAETYPIYLIFPYRKEMAEKPIHITYTYD